MLKKVTIKDNIGKRRYVSCSNSIPTLGLNQRLKKDAAGKR
ncbi:MAG: hypothetical protein QXS74_01405 [Nitrososphaeria archaeon]